MVTDRDSLSLQLATACDGHDHLSHVILAVAAVTALTDEAAALRAVRFAAVGALVLLVRGRLEDQVPLDVDAQALATLLDADFLAVLLDAAVPRAEALGTVLALTDEGFAAAAQPPAMVAARRFVILAELHRLRLPRPRLRLLR